MKTTRMRSRTNRRSVSSGWDSLANPVPGNVFACLQELGIDIIRETNNEISAKCPAHLERTGKEDAHPSWSVNAISGDHNCFSCGFKGSFVDLVRYILQTDRSDAVTWTRNRGGIERVRASLGIGVKASDLVESNDERGIVNEASLALFVEPPADALAKRNISREAARHFGILWDVDKEQWIIPIREPGTAKLIGWQEKNERWFRNRPNNVKKSTCLFGLDVFPGGRAVLLESPLDVARLYTAGIAGGLSSYGVQVSADQMGILRDRVDLTVIALDNDTDGRRLSDRLRKSHAQKMRMRYFNYDAAPDAKDVGDMTDDQIRFGVDNANSAILARFY